MGKQLYLSKLTRRFRIALEESWQGELAINPDRRWLEIIQCKGFRGSGPRGIIASACFPRIHRPSNSIRTAP